MILSEIVVTDIKDATLSDRERQIIAERCPQFVHEVGPEIQFYPLFRGSYSRPPHTNIAGTDIFIGGGYNENRVPKSTSRNIHDRLNQHLFQKFGIKFRNGIYATGDYNQADDYGKVYRFIPVGDFKFCWSPKIKDIFLELNIVMNTNNDPDYLNYKIDEMVDTYRTTDLKAAIMSHNEIMFACKESFLIKM